MSDYHEVYQSWQNQPEEFWRKAAEGIDWFVAPKTTFDATKGVYGRWFPDGECNTCYNAVDRHVESGRGDQAALIYDSPVTETKRTYSYRELQAEVSALARVLQNQGVSKGDRVIIYLPMIPEAVFAMLACARLGAVHSVVFGGFAAAELAVRIDDARPKVIISASCGIEGARVIAYKPLLDSALEIAKNPPKSCLIKQRQSLSCTLKAGRDHDLEPLLEAARGEEILPCAVLAATDPLYILYTSGTTGQPKGVVRDHGGHMVALNWSMNAIYNMQAGEVFWAASDVGWVVGHSYICYAPLLQGCTTVLYEGKPVGTPDAGAFWRVVAEHNVATLFTAPTALRAVKKQDPNGDLVKNYDIGSLRGLFLAGERADPDTVHWAQDTLGCPIIDHWWQTETGWAIAGYPLGLEDMPVKVGSSGVAMPGFDVCILDDDGAAVPAGKLGNIAVKLPLPPSCLPTLWNAEERFRSAYLEQFVGYYATSDAGIIDEDGYISIMSRTDDIINTAGHRLSTGAMEEVIAAHPEIAECAVIGVADALKGQIPIGFYIANDGATLTAEAIETELIALMREKIGPVAAFKIAIAVQRLPKTRSGKILRGTMQKIADGMDWKMPAAIDDPEILTEITAALKTRGYANS